MRRARDACLALVVLLAGCSTGLRLAYDHLDRLARWELGSLVDLDAAQKAAFTAEFKPVWDWHRRTELPRYAAELRTLAAKLEQGSPDRAVIDATLDRAQSFAETAWGRILPGAARLLPLLSDAQVEQLLAHQREDIDKRHAKRLKKTLAERRKKAIDEGQDSLRDWIGELSSTQKQQIENAVDARIGRGEFDPERSRAEALRYLDRLAALLAERRQPDLLDRLKALDDAEPEAEKRADAERRERDRAGLAAMSASLSPAQREKLRSKLLGYAEDFEALSRGG